MKTLAQEEDLQCFPSQREAFGWTEDWKREEKPYIFTKENEYTSEFMVC